MHLLAGSAIGHSQVRCYAQDAPSGQASTLSAPGGQKGEVTKDDADETSFGFQSLSGLLRQSESRPRYSRPNEEDGERAPVGRERTGTGKGLEGAQVDPTFFKASEPGFSPSWTNSYGDTESSERQVRSDAPVPWTHRTQLDATFHPQRRKRGLMERHRMQYGLKEPQSKLATESRRVIVDAQDDARPAGNTRSPTGENRRQRRLRQFGSLSAPAKTEKDNARLPTRRQLQPERPWGISSGDLGVLEMESEAAKIGPPVYDTSERPENSGVTREKSLTHLTSSGEAHMVDVGAKPHTKRVAIATAYISFSNAEPARLITENSNKKGDVLSVARIAGISAAKRTADLIPLCHPLAISHVEVDVEPLPHGARTTFPLPSRGHGCIQITSLVATVGPTGVEMEALTSATAAALTVYDMCKAVDKEMRVEQGSVVYKAGGRSGLWVSKPWASSRNRAFFESRGLPLPDVKTTTRADGR